MVDGRGEGSAEVIKVLNQHLGGQEGAEVRENRQCERRLALCS